MWIAANETIILSLSRQVALAWNQLWIIYCVVDSLNL